MRKNTGVNKIIFIVFLACIFFVLGFSAVKYNQSSTSYSDEGKSMTIHYYNNDNWENPYIYYYMDNYEGESWPGAPMKYEKENWYSYTVYDRSQVKVIFSDNGNNQNPGKDQEGYLVKNDVWYCNGNWYDHEPENTIIHYYNNDNWNKVNIYYYQDGLNSINWPGTPMNRESGNWYVYEIIGFNHPNIVFNDAGSNQVPGQSDPGFSVSGEKWYYDGTWYDENPFSQGDDTSVKVHFYNYNNWNNLSVYYYQNGVVTPEWPGTPMRPEGDGWFEYEISGISCPKVIFNDTGSNQTPGKNEEGYTVTKEVWYRNGICYETRPSDIVVYFYKPDDWNTPFVYYYESDSDKGPVWPGAEMENAGNGWYKYTITKYSTAKILFNDTSHQIPAVGQDGFEVTGVMWYKNGVWYHYNPDLSEDYHVTGDLNGDGIIDDKDADLLQKYLSGEIQLTDEQKKLADTNGDGIVDEKDKEILDQYIDGDITEFPGDDNNDGFTDRKVSYEYDRLGRVTKTIYDSENYIEYIYDKNGNITDVRVTGNMN